MAVVRVSCVCVCACRAEGPLSDRPLLPNLQHSTTPPAPHTPARSRTSTHARAHTHAHPHPFPCPHRTRCARRCLTLWRPARRPASWCAW